MLRPSVDINILLFALGINIDLERQQTLNTSNPQLNLILFETFQVFYPFDRNSVVMEKVDGKKEFLIKTSSDVWEYKGQKNYEIHVAFTNKNKHEKGNWPRGTCSGPYDLE